MALTLGDYRMQSSDPFERGVVKRFEQTSPLMRVMGWDKISGDTYRYRVEEALPGVEWRRVNQGYTESTGMISPRIEEIKIIGGDIFADRFLVRTARRGGDAINLIAEQTDAKSRALAREFERTFFEGDDLVDPDEMMGMRRRITGSQVILAGAGGATLTLSMIDTLLDSVAGDVGKVHLFMAKPVRRKLTDLVNAAGGSVRINYQSVNDFGQQIANYDGFPIHVVEDQWDTSTILDAEDPGDGVADTYSIYAMAFGEMGVMGIYNGDGPMVDAYQVSKETPTTGAANPPGELWRIEFYPGLRVKHPRAAARLRGVLV